MNRSSQEENNWKQIESEKMSNEIEKSGNRKKSEYLKKYEKYEIRKSNKL